MAQIRYATQVTAACVIGSLFAAGGVLLGTDLVAIGLATVGVGLAVALTWRVTMTSDDSSQKRLVTMIRLAEEGHRLAIFDRQTGLYADWYMQLRFREEAARSERYGQPVTLLSVWANSDDDFPAIVRGLTDGLRATDLPGYHDRLHCVVLLPGTTPEGGLALARRILDGAATEAMVGAAQHPGDGHTYRDMLDAAQRNRTELLAA